MRHAYALLVIIILLAALALGACGGGGDNGVGPTPTPSPTPSPRLVASRTFNNLHPDGQKSAGMPRSAITGPGILRGVVDWTSPTNNIQAAFRYSDACLVPSPENPGFFEIDGVALFAGLCSFGAPKTDTSKPKVVEVTVRQEDVRQGIGFAFHIYAPLTNTSTESGTMNVWYFDSPQ